MPLLVVILLLLFLPMITWPLLIIGVALFIVGYAGKTVSDHIAAHNPKYAAWREKRKAEKEKAQIEFDAIKEAMRLDKEEYKRKVHERALEINRGIEQSK
jgi:hypothetical protein